MEAKETQIQRLQSMLLGYANEEAIGKHSKSVFLQCFRNKTYAEDTKTKEILKFCFKIVKEYQKLSGLNKKSDVQFATTICICKLRNVFALRMGRKS